MAAFDSHSQQAHLLHRAIPALAQIGNQLYQQRQLCQQQQKYILLEQIKSRKCTNSQQNSLKSAKINSFIPIAMIKIHDSHKIEKEGKQYPRKQGNVKVEEQRNYPHRIEENIPQRNQDLNGPRFFEDTFIQIIPIQKQVFSPQKQINQTRQFLTNQTSINELKGQNGTNKAKIKLIQQKQCNVCFINRPQNQFIIFSRRCGHDSCCNICLNLHAAALIKEQKKITCPTNLCNIELLKNSISLNVLNDKNRKQYKKLLQKFQKNHFIQCKKKDCSAKIDTHKTLIDQISNNHYIVCPKCESIVCFACRHFWDQCICKSDQKIRQQLQQNFKLSQCPRCKIMVQKQEGCEHIICGICKQNFCHQCSGHWYNGHICPKNRNVRPRANIYRRPYTDNPVMDAISSYCSYCHSKIISQPQPISCLCRSLLFFLKMLLVVLIFLYQILIESLINIFIISPFQQIIYQFNRTQCRYTMIGFIAFPIAYLIFIVKSTPITYRHYSNTQFKFVSFFNQSRF